MGEAQALELRERRRRSAAASERERRRPLVVLGRDLAAEVVDRVVAAPQDPVVGGEPVVVELVAAVAEALAVRASRSTSSCSGESGSVISA